MLEEQAQNGAAATNLIKQLIDSGLMQQDSNDQFIVHGSQGDK